MGVLNCSSYSDVGIGIEDSTCRPHKHNGAEESEAAFGANHIQI